MVRVRVLALLLAGAAAAPAHADTLREALVAAYQTNPTLAAQREALKVNDALVAVARSGGRPTLGATVGVNRDITRSGRFVNQSSKGPYLSVGADLSVPLFNGGAVKNNIRAAKSRTEAGRATLRAVEGDVFVEATAAYMDVIRDRAIVELNANQVKVLATNLEAASDRFDIGDLTRTDVAQSDARLSQGRANLASAEGRLKATEENYRRVIGQKPDALAPPPPLPPLPATPEDAVKIALVNNPDIIAITRQAEASGYDVRVARAGRLPTLSTTASADYANTLGGNGEPIVTNGGTVTAVGIQSRIPIFQGGLPAARIRQAQALEGQVLEQQIGVERLVIAQTRAAFATFQAATLAVSASEAAVKANELALEGSRAENGVGTRTVIEVLNAEQELLSSQVNLVSARRDRYVAGFQLLNAMGQAEADDLGLDGGPLYDPLGNYREVAGDWSDWAGEKRHQPRATRTVTPEEMPEGVTSAQ